MAHKHSFDCIDRCGTLTCGLSSEAAPAPAARPRGYVFVSYEERQAQSKSYIAAKKAEAAAALDTKRGLHGFTVGMPAVKARRIEETLAKEIHFRDAATETRRAFIESQIAAGWTVEKRPDGVRRFINPARDLFHDEKSLTKIGMDYAQHVGVVLLAARPPELVRP